MTAPVTVQELLGQSKAAYDQVRAILNDPDQSEEDKGKVEGYLEEARSTKAKAAQLKEVGDFSTYVEKYEKDQGKEVEIQKRKDPKPFKAWNEFLYAIFLANHKDASIRRSDPRLQRFIEKDKKSGHSTKAAPMVEAVGASGGFLVPTEFLAQLQSVMADESLVRSRATTIRMTRRQIDIPVLDQTGTTAGIPHWFGGMKFYWTEEASSKTVTDAAFRKVSLVAHKLIGYTYASDELVDDSAISLADFLSGPLGFAGGIAWMEDYAFINGSGAGQPLGVINAGATITVNRAATLTVGLADLLNMLENFLPSGRGVWFYTQSALRELMEISGPTGNLSYVFMPSAREGVPATLFGYDAIRTEKCPRIGTAGDFILGDWRYYLIGDRQATTVESTQYDRWEYDETSWRAVHRVDGQPWLSAPLTYQDGTTQVSPFVILGDKST